MVSNKKLRPSNGHYPPDVENYVWVFVCVFDKDHLSHATLNIFLTCLHCIWKLLSYPSRPCSLWSQHSDICQQHNPCASSFVHAAHFSCVTSNYCHCPPAAPSSYLKSPCRRTTIAELTKACMCWSPPMSPSTPGGDTHQPDDSTQRSGQCTPELCT